MLLELDELFEELLDEPFDELLLLEFEDRLLLELLELLEERLLLLLADEFEEEFDDELAELLLLELEERLDELFDAPCPWRPPPLRGPLMSGRLLLELDELLDDELLDDPFRRPPRSSPRPTAAAADFMPRSQPLKKRCTGVSPRGLLSSEAWTRGAALRSTLGNWRIQSRRDGRAWACTLPPVIRAATVAAMARRGCFMRGSTGLNTSPVLHRSRCVCSTRGALRIFRPRW